MLVVTLLVYCRDLVVLVITDGFSFVGSLADACALWFDCCVLCYGLSTLAKGLYCQCSGLWS